MLNKVWDRKETVLDYKNDFFLKSQKWHFFRGVNPCFWSKKCNVLNLFSVKKGLEIRFNDVLDIKETFFTIKTKIFQNKIRSKV